MLPESRRIARLLLQHPTAAQWDSALKDENLLHQDDWRDFLEIREILMRVMLDQQLADLAAGIAPSAKIDPRRFDRQTRARLRWAFKRLKTLRYICV